MNFIEKMLSAERRIPVGIAGVTLSLFFGIAGLYTFFYEKKANISFKIKADFNVLDIKEPIEDLSILLKGRDLKKEKLNLKIIKLLILNDGELDILENYYDSKKEFGLYVDPPAKIIQIRNITASNQYLIERIREIKLLKNGGIILPKSILEKNDFISIDLVILHESSNQKPKVRVVGKIAGIKALKTEDDTKPIDESNLLYRTYSGSFGIQLIRTVSYFLVGAAIIAFSIYLIVVISERLDKRKINTRRKRIGALSNKYTKDKELSWLFDHFIENGLEDIVTLEKMLLRTRILRERVNQFKHDDNVPLSISQTMELSHESDRIYYKVVPRDLVHKAISVGLITVKGKNVKVAPKLAEAVNLILSAS